MKDKIKVLILIKGLGLGGAERMIVDALPYLDRERFDFEVAYLLPWKNFFVPQIEDQGIPVHCLGMQKHYNVVRAFLRLLDLLKSRNFELIHAHLPVAGVMARFAGRLSKTPVVYTEHNLVNSYHPLTAWLNRITFHMNSKVIAVSAEVALTIESVGLCRKAPMVTLKNSIPCNWVKKEAEGAITLKRELGIDPDRPVVGTVAVFRKQKRLHDWIEVCHRIASKHKEVVFFLAGDGPEMPALQARVREIGFEDRLFLPGLRSDGRKVTGFFDIFLMTSDFEGLPIALLEAMALGKAIVATQVGGIPEAVRHGIEGFLAPAGAVDQLAHYVDTLITDEELRKRVGAAAAHRAEDRFDLRSNVRIIEDIYLSVLNKSNERK